MLTDAEYSARYGVNLSLLTPEQAEFTYWSLEMDEARDPETHELLCPAFLGGLSPLWTVRTATSQPATLPVNDVKTKEEQEKAARLAQYIARSWAFEEPEEDEEDEEEENTEKVAV